MIMFKNQYFQTLAVFSCTVGSISDGMQAVWTSPVVPLLQSSDSPLKITQNDVFWFEYLLLIGGIVILPFVSYTMNRIGRKPLILILTLANIIGWILTTTLFSVWTIYVGRLITGCAATTYVVSPLYIGEITDKNIRGFFASWTYLMMLSGFVIMYSIGPFVSICASSMVAIFFLMVQLLAFAFMPESPYYLILKGKHLEAKAALQKLRPNEDIENELSDIALAVRRQQAESGTFSDLFKDRGNRKALIILVVLNWAQEFAGYNVLVMNLQSILSSAVSKKIATVAPIPFSVAMLVAAVMGAGVVDKVGRKPLMFVSSFLTGIVLLALATYFVVHKEFGASYDYQWIPVVLILVYAVTYKIGVGIIPIIAIGELFPMKMKNIGMPIVDLSYCVFAIMSIYVYAVLLPYGVYSSLYVFGVCIIITSIFTLIYIPETKGKSLEEIQLLLKREHRSSSISYSNF